MLRAMNCLGFSLARLDRRLRAGHRHPPGSVAVMSVFPRQQGAVGNYPRVFCAHIADGGRVCARQPCCRKSEDASQRVKGLKLVALSRWQVLALGVALTFAVSAGWAA
jgi:hypothetical protein